MEQAELHVLQGSRNGSPTLVYLQHFLSNDVSHVPVAHLSDTGDVRRQHDPAGTAQGNKTVSSCT